MKKKSRGIGLILGILTAFIAFAVTAVLLFRKNIAAAIAGVPDVSVSEANKILKEGLNAAVKDIQLKQIKGGVTNGVVEQGYAKGTPIKDIVTKGINDAVNRKIRDELKTREIDAPKKETYFPDSFTQPVDAPIKVKPPTDFLLPIPGTTIQAQPVNGLLPLNPGPPKNAGGFGKGVQMSTGNLISSIVNTVTTLKGGGGTTNVVAVPTSPKVTSNPAIKEKSVYPKDRLL